MSENRAMVDVLAATATCRGAFYEYAYLPLVARRTVNGYAGDGTGAGAPSNDAAEGVNATSRASGNGRWVATAGRACAAGRRSRCAEERPALPGCALQLSLL